MIENRLYSSHFYAPSPQMIYSLINDGLYETYHSQNFAVLIETECAGSLNWQNDGIVGSFDG